MSKAHNGNDYERLKEELRRLKRRSAPWYFESALHQRLHGGPGRRHRLRPISFLPVLVVAVITLCILGLAVYVLFVHTNLILPGSHREGSPPPDSVSHVVPGDSLNGPPGRISPSVKGSPRAASRAPAPVRSDTLPARPPDDRAAGGDTAIVRGDTAVSHTDSSSHGLDTAVSPGAERRSE
jgi:hypothetical protein